MGATDFIDKGSHCKEVQKMVGGMTEAEIMEKYKNLVYKMAKKVYINKKHLMDKDMDFEDLVQFGYIGLLDAYRSYKEDGGANFTTYAYTCIPNRIIRDAFRQKRIKAMIALDSGISLDAQISNDDDNDTFSNILASEDDFEIENTVYEDIRIKLFNRLPSDERNLLVWYNIYGLTYDDISKRKGVSTTRIGHLIKDISNRLRVQYARECRNA